MKFYEISIQNLAMLKSYQECPFQLGTTTINKKDCLENLWGMMTKTKI